MRSRRHASWARIISRAASTSTGGTTTLVNEPASSSRASRLRVLAVSLHPIRRAPRRLARRDHLHAHPGRARSAIEPKTGRPGLIASTYRAGQTQKPRDRLLDARPEPCTQQLTRRDVNRRSVSGAGMDIEPRISHHSGHGRTSSSNWGQPEPFSGQTNPREECPAYPGGQPKRATYGIGSSSRRLYRRGGSASQRVHSGASREGASSLGRQHGCATARSPSQRIQRS